MTSLRKLLNKGLSRFRLELKRLPPKISPHTSAHDVLWNSDVPLFKNYHVGCGSILAKGFLNIDDVPLDLKYDFKENYFYEVKEFPGAFILKYDLSHGIPAHHGSLQRIYHSHFLEHLTRDQGVKFLKDCYYSLEDGGTMRFALPDFRLWCENYIKGQGDFFSWYRTNYLPDDEYHFHTHAQIFTGMLYNHGHQMAYDFESISLLLTKVGFRDINLGVWGDSMFFEELELLEAQDSQRKLESLVIECRK
jgi:predicted SAM-dependent methyltransferase